VAVGAETAARRGGGAGGGGGRSGRGEGGDLGREAGDLGVALGGAGLEAVVLAGEGGVTAESDGELVFGGLELAAELGGFAVGGGSGATVVAVGLAAAASWSRGRPFRP